MNPETYAKALQAYFVPYADSLNAGRMSKYMLNQFEFLGIQSPLRKQLTTQFISMHGLPTDDKLDETVKLIWEMPQRELHYVIMEIASRKKYLTDTGRIELYKFMITHNSWWDTVDFIASNLAGAWLLKHKAMAGPVTGDFIQSGNMWLQRTALLFQLKYRGNTNQALLFRYINELKGSKEFFIRKAIGWALREYSKTNAGAVLEFTNNTVLSPLSRREAIKVIYKQKTHE